MEQCCRNGAFREVILWRFRAIIFFEIFLLTKIESLKSSISDDLSIVDVVSPAGPDSMSLKVGKSLIVVNVPMPLKHSLI